MGLARRLHVWLGWIIGVPLLFWTVSGLWMVLRPIDEVRGTALRRAPAALVMPARLIVPSFERGAVRTLALEPLPDGPVWVARFADGKVARADPLTGRWLPPINAAAARRIAIAAYARAEPVAEVRRTSAANPPLDLRQSRPAWRIRFANGTNIYVDGDSGVVLALRTAQWRLFDWMWGLHIMDLRGREDSSHPILIGAAGLALVATLLGLLLLPFSTRGSRRQ